MIDDLSPNSGKFNATATDPFGRAFRPPPGDVSAAPRHPRVLVVDDDRKTADSLAQLLSLMGYEAFAAYSGAEAIEQLATVKPGCIFLDIAMPVLNGYQTCLRLREQPDGKHIVIAAVTAWNRRTDRQQAQESGFDHYLTKPVQWAAMEAVIANVTVNDS